MSAKPAMSRELKPIVAKPFPHVVVDGFLDGDLYRELSETFPRCPPGSGSMGYSLYSGDSEYEDLIAQQPSWRALYEATHCQAFVEFAATQFCNVIRDESRVEPDRVRYVPHRETRADKQDSDRAQSVGSPNDLWVGMDVKEGSPQYRRGLHLDHRWRLTNLLLYFCDADESEMAGGRLLLHPSDSGFPQWRRRSIAPRHNRMVMFACHDRSFHSVSRIVHAGSPRRYVQIHVSSMRRVWGDPEPSTLARVKRRFLNSAPGRRGGQLVHETRLARAALRRRISTK